MDYTYVIESVKWLNEQGWAVETIAEADGYPVYALENNEGRSGQRPRLLITAGIHGEEPASVVGTVQWLMEHGSRWRDDIDITAVPCINPWGYERGIRHGPHGKDLNREFDDPKHPFTQGVHAYLTGRTFHLFMDEHEDCDFFDMYAYELKDPADVSLARRILERCHPFVPLSHGQQVEPFSTERGLVRPIQPGVEVGDREHLEGLPIALWVFDDMAKRTVTVETPGMQPFDLRVRLHGEALDEACHYLSRHVIP